MRQTVDFLLHDWLQIETLTTRPRFSDHSRDTFDAILTACERLAAERFAPFNRTADLEEPRLDDDSVRVPESTRAAFQAYVDSGMMLAPHDHALGGMQLPCTVQMAANAFFWKASIALSAGPGLTAANANLLLVHGTATQRTAFALPQLSGAVTGTMCLSETQAGSSLSDILTRAVPDGTGFDDDVLGPRYRLHGSKMWISNGDHELTSNIFHLVLAKIPDATGALPSGTRGISLFLVPKWLVHADGRNTGERNDVMVAGLNHKLGFRGTPNTLLNFGEGRYPVRGAAGAIGYRIGGAGEGLRCMFHMMNEARIGVGLGASCLGLAGFEASLAYARERRQGRPVGPAGKDAAQPQVRLVDHADVRRMLLAQKAYAEGGLALALYCARLVDEERTGEGHTASEATALLDLLTPIVKSWPSQWCLEANSLAIQVHGGYGYTRDFPVEQYWRDNRLNMIHEGTHGIQAQDLLGRKVLANEGRSLHFLLQRFRQAALRARQAPALSDLAPALEAAAIKLEQATREAWTAGAPEEVLANSVPYLEALGHCVVAWIWLDVAATASLRGEAAATVHHRGFVQTARYFLEFELPKIDAWLAPVAARNATVRQMQDDWF